MLPKNKEKIAEYRKKLSLKAKGNKNAVGTKRTDKHIDIIKKTHTGKILSEEQKKKISKNRAGKCLGKDNGAWKGGKSKCIDCSKDVGYTAKRCIDCRYKFIKGKNNPSWKGGITPSNRIERASKKFKEWRKKVFERDDYQCQKCGNRSGQDNKVYLHPHHIMNFSEYKELRFDMDNGITFCKGCHNTFHRLFGRKNNNKEQVDNFIYLIWRSQP